MFTEEEILQEKFEDEATEIFEEKFEGKVVNLEFEHLCSPTINFIEYEDGNIRISLVIYVDHDYGDDIYNGYYVSPKELGIPSHLSYDEQLAFIRNMTIEYLEERLFEIAYRYGFES